MADMNLNIKYNEKIYNSFKSSTKEAKNFQKQMNETRTLLKSVSKTNINIKIKISTSYKNEIKTFMSFMNNMKTPILIIKEKVTSVLLKIKEAFLKVWNLFLKKFNINIGSIGSILKLFSNLMKIKRILGFISKIFMPQIKIKNDTEQTASRVYKSLKILGKFKSNPIVKIKDGATKAIASIGNKLKDLAKKTFSPKISAIKDKAIDFAKESFQASLNQERQQVAIRKSVVGNKKGTPQAADNYVKKLKENANNSAFSAADIMSTGTKAVRITGGNTVEALNLVKIAEDMAAANPEKSLSDAFDALAKMKGGDASGMADFGMEISKKDIKKAGGSKAVINNKIASHFKGGSNALENTTGGMLTSMKNKVGTALTDTGVVLLEKAKPLLSSINELVGKLAPKLKDVGGKIAEAFGSGVKWVSQLTAKAGGVKGIFNTINKTFKKISKVVMPVAEGIFSIFTNSVSTLLPVVTTIFGGIAEKVTSVIGIISDKMGFIKGVFDFIVPLLAEGLQTAWDIISPILDIAITLFGTLCDVMEFVWPTIQSVMQKAWDVLQPIYASIAEAMTWVGDAVKSIIGWFGDVFKGVFDKGAKGSKKEEKDSGSDTKAAVSRAIGVQRVPYDNYLINAHQGEMLLTNQEARRYLSQTRGVSLQNRKKETSSFTNNKANNTSSTGTNNNTSKQQTTFNLNKLTDTIVIHKDADADKVVDHIVKRLQKVSINMA